MKGIEIVSTGSYIPGEPIPNDRFTEIVETSDEWIVTRTGIKARHFSNGEPTWYMGAEAAKNALEMAGISAKEIDFVLVTCCTPDYYTPTVACMVQREIGAVNAGCMDINCACSGFVYGLDMARRYLNFDDVKTVLLVSVERLSQMIDFTDRSSCVLLGDGAAACVLRAKEGGRFASVLAADGAAGGVLNARHTRRESPFLDESKRGEYFDFPEVRWDALYMDGKEVYKFATRVFPESIKEACSRLGITPNDLSHLVPHQANYRIVATALKTMGIDDHSKVFLNLDKYGNTGSASIPIALDEMNRQGLLKRGELVGVCGFGGGLTYASAVFEW